MGIGAVIKENFHKEKVVEHKGELLRTHRPCDGVRTRRCMLVHLVVGCQHVV